MSFGGPFPPPATSSDDRAAGSSTGLPFHGAWQRSTPHVAPGEGWPSFGPPQHYHPGVATRDGAARGPWPGVAARPLEAYSDAEPEPFPVPGPRRSLDAARSERERSSLDLYGSEHDGAETFWDPDLPDAQLNHALRNHRTPYHGKRRARNQDEFDGPHQLLEPLTAEASAALEAELPHLPTHLVVQEQEAIVRQVQERLSGCAFHFVARYQFPIPLELDKRAVRRPSDREWTEWVFFLKRLATKRRIPARVLYHGQIRQLATVLEHAAELRPAAAGTASPASSAARPLKDDRYLLQLISAATQVAKILKDPPAMYFFDRLYLETEDLIRTRTRARPWP
ncbi:MAG: hypothetical protein M1826_004766 [Phylliscum demangeonii]|nr:MAG: hypothetical protein M1826_004766 [Phylliscum demangeonii]